MIHDDVSDGVGMWRRSRHSLMMRGWFWSMAQSRIRCISASRLCFAAHKYADSSSPHSIYVLIYKQFKNEQSEIKKSDKHCSGNNLALNSNHLNNIFFLFHLKQTLLQTSLQRLGIAKTRKAALFYTYRVGVGPSH